MPDASIRKRIEIQGVVQGVGFRPFVYRIARRFDIHGSVLNSSEGVIIEAEGGAIDVANFLDALRSELPPLARIDRLVLTEQPVQGAGNFVIEDSLIEQSLIGQSRFALVPPDVATCASCAADFTTPSNRRFAYPFTNCTNCGPRYTIIRDVPYDRPLTTMASFGMCGNCLREYQDPLDRRFHAEPNACPVCGPSLTILSDETLSNPADILARARQLLRQGKILAPSYSSRAGHHPQFQTASPPATLASASCCPTRRSTICSSMNRSTRS
jgi:hydrogenase maturation protein HypF